MNDVSCLFVYVFVTEVNCNFSNLRSAGLSMQVSLDLPPNMTNFVLPRSAKPSMLFQANLHAAWWVTVLLSSQQCNIVPV